MAFVKTGLSKEPGEDQQRTDGAQRFSRCDPGQFVLEERCLNVGLRVVAGSDCLSSTAQSEPISAQYICFLDLCQSPATSILQKFCEKYHITYGGVVTQDQAILSGGPALALPRRLTLSGGMSCG